MLTVVMQSTQIPKVQARVTFGLFEADLNTGELWKAGYRVKLQGLPFKVLKILVQNAGEVVSREELQAGLWGPDVIVDFEHSLSNAIKKLREALGDSADNPRFIETLARRGFRFIAPVGLASTPSANTYTALHVGEITGPTAPPLVDVPVSDVLIADPAVVARPNRHMEWVLISILGVLVVGLSVQLWNLRWRSTVLPRIHQITQEGTIYSPKDLLLGTLSGIATDGVHIFTPSNENGRVVLSQISVATGASQTLPIPSQIGVPEVEDMSPDRTQLLLRSNLAAASQQPLWIVPIDGGSAFRVSDVMTQSATWMPDGKNILYASGNQLSVVSLENGRSTSLTTSPGRPFWLRWSPDGKLLRFTVIDSLNHTSSIWQMAKGESTAHQILEVRKGLGGECCGAWTADGKDFIFEATTEGVTDLWKMRGSSDSNPVKITNGPLDFKEPLPGPTGDELIFIGQDIHSRLERFDSGQKQFVPVQGFLSVARRISYSRDGEWVAWVDPNGRLWRARSDGTERVLLTPAPMQVLMVTWSPDSARLAFMSRSPNEPWQVYTVRSEGGTPERLTQENRNLGDPSFSADGKSIVFGTIPELMSQAGGTSPLSVMNLATHQVTPFPHSEGMYSPKWSPDGRYLVALTLDQKRLTLYDTQASTWTNLSTIPADHPFWSKDGKSIYFHSSFVEGKPVYKISIPGGQPEKIADLSNFHVGSITHAEFNGLTPDDVPLMHAEVSSGNLYSINLKEQH